MTRCLLYSLVMTAFLLLALLILLWEPKGKVKKLRKKSHDDPQDYLVYPKEEEMTKGERRNLMILKNIESYDGTDKGQKEV